MEWPPPDKSRQPALARSGPMLRLSTAPVAAVQGPVSGWLSVKAPVLMEIHEGGRLIGTTDSDRLMMSAGRHEIELVNETLGYRGTKVVQVPAGKVAAVRERLRCNDNQCQTIRQSRPIV